MAATLSALNPTSKEMKTIMDAERNPMARSEQRPVITLRSTAGTGTAYVTRKNRRNDPDRMVLSKYDPAVGRHVPFREER